MVNKTGRRGLQSIIRNQIEIVRPDESVLKKIKEITKDFVSKLNYSLMSEGIGADAFVGGSFAKNTLIKEDGVYDVDLFVRFNWEYLDISPILEKVLKKTCNEMNLRLEVIHGSRDYFKVHGVMHGNGYFEVIPVTKIKKPSEERNVTDLSYFHVPYVKRKIKGLEDQVRLTKSFLKAQKVYGAETYVKGFSGYAVELLVIYYGSFIKVLRELSKVKIGERPIIDIEKHYKTKNQVFIELNEAKLHSPVILIDPTYKERNALAALSEDTFIKFQKAAGDFLKKPSGKFFVEESVDLEKMKKMADKRNAEFLHLIIETDRQEGDIAGTKMKKFAELLINEIDEYYSVIKFEFDYSGKQKADVYLIVKSRGEVIRIGPPVHLKKFVRDFKKEHINTYEKNKMIHAKIKVMFTARSYIDVWKKTKKNKMNEMGVIEMEIK